MYLDDECDIINFIRNNIDDSVLFNGNAFNRKVYNCLKDINSLTINNSHEALPPDFYSETHSIMFDVMRVNDTERTKTCNIVKITESRMEKEIKNVGFSNDSHIYIDSHMNDEHIYARYVKQSQRVLQAHMNKINIWKQQHPNIAYKGLVVCDETECYFEGDVFPCEPYSDAFDFICRMPLTLHKPWHDENFMKGIYDCTDLDFVVWVNLYKKYSAICQKTHSVYPCIVICDVRYPYRCKHYIEYDCNHLVVS